MFRDFIDQHKRALIKMFGGQGVQNLEKVAAELRTQAYSAQAARGSPTASYLIGTEKSGLHGATSSHSMLGALIGGHAGGLIGSVAAAGGMAVKDAITAAGLKTRNDIVAAMLLSPDFTRAVIARQTPLSQKRLLTALQGLPAGAFAGATQDKKDTAP